jgi:hypothetical protein
VSIDWKKRRPKINTKDPVLPVLQVSSLTEGGYRAVEELRSMMRKASVPAAATPIVVDHKVIGLECWIPLEPPITDEGEG